MRSRIVNATEFKRAVAILQPVKSSGWKSPAGAWSKKVEISGDIVTHDSARLWEAQRKRPAK
jgi:hypothetical protein